MSLNIVSVMGNLTRNPEIKLLNSGKQLCNFSIANNRVFVKGSEKMKEVSYFDVEVWGSTAENCAKYLIKGSGIIVEGRLRQERWEKDGKAQSNIKIIANIVHFLPKNQSKIDGPDSAAIKNIVEEIASSTSMDDPAWSE